MQRCFTATFALAASALFASYGASAQVVSDAHRPGALLAGVTYSNASSDYAPQRIAGVGFYSTLDVTRHLGLEADVRLLQFRTPNDFAERTYMAGLRYAYRVNRFELYAKGLAGAGQTVAQAPYEDHTGYVPSTSFAAAFGGGLDIAVARKLTVRAVDFEYQDWPNFASNYGGSGLAPAVVSVGIGYRIR